MAEAVGGLKDRIDGAILIAGGRTLVQGLLTEGLAGELRLMILPVVPGSGARLLPDSPDRTELELLETRSWDPGVVLLVHRPAAAPAA